MNLKKNILAICFAMLSTSASAVISPLYVNFGTGLVKDVSCSITNGTAINVISGNSKTQVTTTGETALVNVLYFCQYHVNFDGDIYVLSYVSESKIPVDAQVNVELFNEDVLMMKEIQ